MSCWIDEDLKKNLILASENSPYKKTIYGGVEYGLRRWDAVTERAFRSLELKDFIRIVESFSKSMSDDRAMRKIGRMAVTLGKGKFKPTNKRRG